MKNLFLGLAVCSLTIVSCGEKKSDKKEEGNTEDNKTEAVNKTPVISNNPGGLNVVWVDMDSLSLQYDRMKDLNKTAETKIAESQQKLMSAQKRAETKAAQLEKEFKYMTLSDQQKAQQTLQKLQNDFAMLQQSLQVEMAQFERDAAELTNSALNSFIEKYADENSIDFVLRKSYTGSGILYGNGAKDVTRFVIDGLNKEYKDRFNVESDTLK